MRKFRFLIFLVSTFILFASMAEAGPLLRLRVDDLTTGQSVVITDNGSGDMTAQDGAITFSGAVGGFQINVTTGLSKPAIGETNNYAELDLNSVNVRFTGAGTLRLTLEDGDYTLGPNGPLSVGAMLGGTLSAPAGSSVTFQSWADSDNLLPDLGADSPVPGVLAPIGAFPVGRDAAFTSTPTFGPGAFSTSGSGEFNKTGNYSLFSQATLVFTGSGNVSFDLNTSVVPEPTSVLLLGSGLAALGLLGRKKARKSDI